MPEIEPHRRIAQLEGQAAMLSQMIRQAKDRYLAAFLRHKESIDRAICRQEELYWKTVELYYTEWGMMSAGDTILTAGLGALKLPKAAQQLARVRWLLRAHWAASKANDAWSLGSYGKELATGKFPAVEKLVASLPREGKYVVALLADNPEEHIKRTHDQMSSRLYPSHQDHQKIKELFPSPSFLGTALRRDRNLRGNMAAETMTFVTRKRYVRWLGKEEDRLRTGIRQLENACANLRGELHRNRAALESVEKQAEAARLAAVRATKSAAERQSRIRGLFDECRRIDEGIRGWKHNQADWTRTQNRLSTDLRRAMQDAYRKVMRNADTEIEKLRARRKACEDALEALGATPPAAARQRRTRNRPLTQKKGTGYFLTRKGDRLLFLVSCPGFHAVGQVTSSGQLGGSLPQKSSLSPFPGRKKVACPLFWRYLHLRRTAGRPPRASSRSVAGSGVMA